MLTMMASSGLFGRIVFVGMAIVFVLAAANSARSAAAGADEIASSVDLRPRFADAGLRTRAQGSRNTCSVFTVIGALEYALAQRGETGLFLSVEFLNWASNETIGEHEDGSYFSDLWKGFEAYGVCDEADEPYRKEFDANYRPGQVAMEMAAKRKSAGLRLHWIKPWNVNTGLTDDEFKQVKQTLADGWPVCGGFRWLKKEHWTKGVLDWAPAEGVRDGHSVVLAGYRDDPTQSGGGVFIIRNSGKGLRDGFMSYQFAKAYMNDAVWIDCPPTKGRARATTDRPQAATGPVRSQPVDLDTSLLNPMGQAVVGRNRRVSSNEQPEWNNANLDMDWLMPGEAVHMPFFEGPGVITHMWFTSHSGWANELNSLVLRVYWDGNNKPGVEVPLGDFFAVGQGKPAPVESIPVQVSPTGSLSCFWRMPFAKSARIVVTNENPDRSTGLYWQVDWVQIDKLPAKTPYFYAKFRREYPAVLGRDYTIADLAGRGFYVGSVYSVTMAQDGWFGEGDDFFYIDGEEIPSLQGTGTEDYFNDAWGFRTRTGSWFGQPRFQGYSAGDSLVCYRWHLADPVNFAESLHFAIEHKGNLPESEDGFFIERPDFISSVAFWYQLGEPKEFGELPPWHERRVPWQHHHLVKAFQKTETTGDSKVEVQTIGFFGSRPTLIWRNSTPGATIEFPFELNEDGRYAVRLTAGNGAKNGAFIIEIDGKKALEADFRSSEETEADLLLGTHELKSGSHTLTLRAVEDAERIGPLVIEELRLLSLPPEARRENRNHNEAHFIRLGLGRAIYAYRLAYGKLPDSFDTLVKSGIMPERYTRDENGLPLEYRVEDGYFIVTSPADPGWTHRWQGHDARR